MILTGESGTGKELIAQALHDNSDRRDKPLIKVNCAAIPANLIESELFGYEKGAFTGATTSKPGRFELADGGTLFLDEAGEIPGEMQVKLLRALQYGEFERVGGLKTNKVDVRLVAATNRELRQAIEVGDFQADWSKIQRTLGWEPRVSMIVGLERTVAFYREHGEHYWTKKK